MAISDLSFKLYNETGLSDLFTGTFNTTARTDLSIGAQDFTKYFGSLSVGTVLKASAVPGTTPITLTPTDNVSEWATSTAHTLGETIQPTGGGNTYVYTCTTAGTTDATTEPTWPTSGIGSTVTDGTVVWTLRGKKHNVNEVVLALTEAALDTNTPGAALSLGTSISSGAANEVEIWFRFTNAVATLSNTTAHPDISFNFNAIQEETA